MLKYILCVHDFVGGLRKLNYLHDLDYFIIVMDFIQSYFYLYIIFYLLISILYFYNYQHILSFSFSIDGEKRKSARI